MPIYHRFGWVLGLFKPLQEVLNAYDCVTTGDCNCYNGGD